MRCYALDQKTLQQCLDMNHEQGSDFYFKNTGNTPQYTKEDEAYFFEFQQGYDGIPVCKYQLNQTLEKQDFGYGTYAYGYALYSNKGLIDFEVSNLFDMEKAGKKQKIVPLSEVLDKSVSGLKNLIAGKMSAEIREISLCYLPVLKDAAKMEFEAEPVWVIAYVHNCSGITTLEECYDQVTGGGFVILFYMLCVVGGGLDYCMDVKNHYMRYMVIRNGVRPYAVSKTITSVISGYVSMFLGQIMYCGMMFVYLMIQNKSTSVILSGGKDFEDMCWVILVFTYIRTDPVRACAREMGLSVTPYFFAFQMSDAITRMLFYFGLILLLCDAPFTDSQQMFVLSRTGRRKWFLGQILYIFLASAVFFLLVAAASVILFIPYVAPSVKWGTVFQICADNNAYTGVVMPKTILTSYTPLQACLLLFAVNTGIGTLLGLLIFFGNLFKSRIFGSAMAMAWVLVSNIFSWYHNDLMRHLSPVTWADLTLFENPASGISYGYAAGFIITGCLLLAGLILIRSKRYTIEVLEEL